MNQQIRKLAAGLIVLYLVLFVQLNVLQVGRKSELDANPLNNRQTIRDFNRPRGDIVTADGVVVGSALVNCIRDNLGDRGRIAPALAAKAAELDYLVNSKAAITSLAENYVGLPY